MLPPSKHRKKLTRKNIEDLRNYMKQRRGEEDKQIPEDLEDIVQSKTIDKGCSVQCSTGCSLNIGFF